MERLTESQVSSALFDQPRFDGGPAKIFICSTPRSGSYLLSRFMIHAGLGVPHEYFNPILMREIGARLGLGSMVGELQWRPRHPFDAFPPRKWARQAEIRFLDAYARELMPIRCHRGIFAAKIHFDHYLKVLDNEVGHALLDGSLFIHLYRENLLNQAVSTRFSDLTGRWGVDDTVTTVPDPNPDFFSRPALDALINGLAEDDKGWRIFFAQNGIKPLSISYENLCQDVPSVTWEIGRRIGLDPDELRTDYREGGPPPETDQSLPPKKQVAEHYVEGGRTVRGVTAVQAAAKSA